MTLSFAFAFVLTIGLLRFALVWFGFGFCFDRYAAIALGMLGMGYLFAQLIPFFDEMLGLIGGLLVRISSAHLVGCHRCGLPFAPLSFGVVPRTNTGATLM